MAKKRKQTTRILPGKLYELQTDEPYSLAGTPEALPLLRELVDASIAGDELRVGKILGKLEVLPSTIRGKNAPRNPGKPMRNAIIIELAAQGMSDGEIARHPRVMAENNGERMARGAVQQVRLRHGLKKRRLQNDS